MNYTKKKNKARKGDRKCVCVCVCVCVEILERIIKAGFTQETCK